MKFKHLNWFFNYLLLTNSPALSSSRHHSHLITQSSGVGRLLSIFAVVFLILWTNPLPFHTSHPLFYWNSYLWLRLKAQMFQFSSVTQMISPTLVTMNHSTPDVNLPKKDNIPLSVNHSPSLCSHIIRAFYYSSITLTKIVCLLY